MQIENYQNDVKLFQIIQFGVYLMSEGSRSRSLSREKTLDKHKLFVTNLDGTANQKDLQEELRTLFEEYGKVGLLAVRKNNNAGYCFAFIEYDQGFDATNVIEKLNGKQIRGKQMKVELQDSNKRRKDTDKGCYNCGRKGHFARECRSDKNGSRNFRGRSKSRSRDSNHRRRGRSPSQSSERDRSRAKRKKQKKDRDRRDKSRDKEEKKKKKHKKRRSSSNSS